MAGGGNTQTTTSEPWIGQQPFIRDINTQAQQLYYGGGPQFFPGSTVVPFAPQTQQGMDLTTQRALGGDPTMTAFGNYLYGALNQGQINPFDANSIFGNVNAGAPSLDAAANFAGMPGAAGAAGAGMNQLQATAQGDFLGQGNPYLDQMYQTGADRIMEQFSEDIMPSLNASFGGAAGSGIHQIMAGRAAGDTAQALAGMYSDIYAPAYEAERNRQLGAAGTLQQDNLSRIGAASGLYGTGVGAQLGAAGGMSDLFGAIGDQQFRAGTLQPGYTQQQYADIDRLMGVGGMVENQAQNYLQADIDRWNFNQQAPFTNLQNYAASIYGMPGSYGTTTATGPGGSTLGSAAGGALTGFSVGGPIGAGIGGLAGLLGFI